MTLLVSRPVTRLELLENGTSRTQIDAMRRSGELRSVFRGVYVSAAVEDSLELRAEAAALVLGPNQVVCDRAAAFLHGVDAYGLREAHARPLETCVLRGGVRARRQGVDGRERDLARFDIERRHGLALTTPLRTALDLGCALPRHRALGVMDELARRHCLDRATIEAGSRRFRGRRGVIQLRDLATLVDPLAESQRESWLRLDIADAGLPMPTLQWWVIDEGQPLWRLDLAYPAQKVAVEYDGELFHRESADQIDNDARRRAWLRAHGWTLIVVRKEDFESGARLRWIEALRDALAPQTRRFRWELARNNGRLARNN